MGFTANSYSYGGITAATCMQNLEDNDLALRNHFASANAPDDIVTGMLWHHTTYGMRIRANAGAWHKVLTADASQKMWVYRNTACEGWTVDSSVTDRVLALKGGSNGYSVNGGNPGGSWTPSGHTHASGTFAVNGNHTHQWYNFVDGNNHGQTYDSDGNAIDLSTGGAITTTGGAKHIQLTTIAFGEGVSSIGDSYVKDGGNNVDVDGTSASSNEPTTSRPAAAVGTLQYPDLTDLT